MHIPIQISFLISKIYENSHLDSQDKSSLQLGGSTLQSLLDCSNPWTNSEQLIILQGTYDLCLLYNS